MNSSITRASTKWAICSLLERWTQTFLHLRTSSISSIKVSSRAKHLLARMDLRSLTFSQWSCCNHSRSCSTKMSRSGLLPSTFRMDQVPWFYRLNPGLWIQSVLSHNTWITSMVWARSLLHLIINQCQQLALTHQSLHLWWVETKSKETRSEMNSHQILFKKSILSPQFSDI